MLLLDRLRHHSLLGTAMRAVSFDRATVPLLGVPVDLVISATFALGAGLAGAAGTLYALAYPVVDPYMGIMVGWKAFISAVIGGIGNIRGAMVGAFILGSTAAALGYDVQIFFTFYGLQLLRKDLSDVMISPLANPAMPMPIPMPVMVQMLPGMESMATIMMKQKMKSKGVASLEELRDLCLET